MPSATDRGARLITAVLLAIVHPPFAIARNQVTHVPQGPAADYPVVIGDPFSVDGTTYVPRDTLNYDAVGYAEPGLGGDAITGAHRTLPLPCYVEVTSLASGKTILLRLTQRGPMSGSNLLALSAGAWTQLGLGAGATAPVRVRRVNPPEVERAMLRAGHSAPERMETPAGLLGVLKRKLAQSGNTMLSEGSKTGAPTANTPGTPRSAAPLAKPLPARADAARRGRPSPARKAAVEPETQVAMAAPPPPPPPPAHAAEEATAKPVTRGLFVQVGAFASKDRARAVASRSGAGIMRAGTLWRVRLGPYADQASANRALAKARGAGYGDSRIVHEP